MRAPLCVCGRLKAQRSEVERVLLGCLAAEGDPAEDADRYAYRVGALSFSAEYTLAAFTGRCTWCIEAFPVQLAGFALVAAGGAL